MPAADTQHLEKLRTYWTRNHAFPSMAKLCEVVGLSSTASVFDLVSRRDVTDEVAEDLGHVYEQPGLACRTRGPLRWPRSRR